MARLTPRFIDSYADRSPAWGFNGLGYVVYKRTYARPIPAEGRSEEWHETVGRVVNGAIDIGAGLTQEEAEELYEFIFDLKALPGGRMLWQLGTPNNERMGGDSLVNCWFVNLEDITDFGWMFERLMLGGGVGFSVEHAEALGKVRQGKVEFLPEANDADFIVPDKREGWADLLMRVIRCYLPRRDNDYDAFSFSTKLVRPEGAPISTFGGVASGPGILVEGVQDITKILDGAVGRHLTSVEVLDIANVIGSIVVSGNVRRSAQIALGSPDDEAYLQAKRWDLGGIPAYRAMSNNSVYVNKVADLPDEFWEGYAGKGEPYGLVNLAAARTYGRMGEKRMDLTIEGFNPCAEIALANRESCNLSEIVLPHFESAEELQRAARLLYKVQKAVAAMRYLDPVSDDITSTNMRLGMGVTGVAQATEKQFGWLDSAYVKLNEFDKEWSEQNAWPPSVRLTTVKPSGTLSLLAGVTPGVHAGYSRYHIRRVRFAYNDPMLEYCRAKGYPWEWSVDFEGEEDHRTAVVEFPASFPEGTKLASDTSAIEQLQAQSVIQRDWADNAVSVTVTYRPEELDDIKDYLGKHFASFKSVSFLPYSDHGFNQAPLEPITDEEYQERISALSEDSVHVHGFSGELLDSDCEGGACPIR